jgi:hypothetical protein
MSILFFTLKFGPLIRQNVKVPPALYCLWRQNLRDEFYRICGTRVQWRTLVLVVLNISVLLPEILVGSVVS